MRIDERSEFIHPPRWRTRATEPRLRLAVLVTFSISVAIGLGLLVLAMVGLGALGAPTWVVLLPWLLPTAGVVAWTSWRPRPADRHDDDHGWIDYTTTHVLVGDGEPRPAPLRLALAIVVGGPIGWLLLLGLAAELTGVV